MRGLGGGAGPGAAAFGPGDPPPAAEEEVVEENSGGEDEELELGLCLGSKKQQQQLTPAPCRILTARDLQPAAALSPDSSVSSSSPAAAGPTAERRTKAEDGSAPAASPGTVGSGHPQSFGVVGWPPIRTYRMNSLFGQAKDNVPDADTKKTAAGESELQKDKEESEKKGRAPGWVKVNMDGEVIGRKVDLNAHRSYKTLALALEIMFTRPSAGLCASNSTKSLMLLDNSSECQLTYEDRDGDWMLVGDVPWEMFVGSVKRLRIMRTSDAGGLGARGQAAHRTVATTRGRT